MAFVLLVVMLNVNVNQNCDMKILTLKDVYTHYIEINVDDPDNESISYYRKDDFGNWEYFDGFDQCWRNDLTESQERELDQLLNEPNCPNL